MEKTAEEQEPAQVKDTQSRRVTGTGGEQLVLPWKEMRGPVSVKMDLRGHWWGRGSEARGRQGEDGEDRTAGKAPPFLPSPG